MKKPFLVTIEIEYAAMAEDEAEAIEHAREVVSDSYLTDHCFAQPLARLPDGWEPDSLVYGTDHDMTVQEALDLDVDFDE